MDPNNQKSTLIKSFEYAFSGIFRSLVKERNFQIHLIITFLVVIAGFYFRIEKMEWVSLLLMIAFVLSLEAINSCIERICDFISPEYNEKIKTIKDVSAGFVLIAAIIAVVIGCIVFIPYLISCFNSL